MRNSASVEKYMGPSIKKNFPNSYNALFEGSRGNVTVKNGTVQTFTATFEGKGQLHQVLQYLIEKKVWGNDGPQEVTDLYWLGCSWDKAGGPSTRLLSATVMTALPCACSTSGQPSRPSSPRPHFPALQGKFCKQQLLYLQVSRLNTTCIKGCLLTLSRPCAQAAYNLVSNLVKTAASFKTPTPTQTSVTASLLSSVR